jgi:monofunctional biosynthetic peptidoglycan transglycosylase
MGFRSLRFLKSIFSLAALKRCWRWGWRLALILLLADAAYLAGIWPKWEEYAAGSILKSNFIRAYVVEQREDANLPALRWRPVPLSRISYAMRRAAVVAEDARFYEHDGIDFEAFHDAMQRNIERRRMVFGASTISQQTVKNLFLSPSRDPLRKWHELWITLAMERNLDKQRILEYYLNVAEFGRGVYGVEAAARFYYGISASDLRPREAIELAATLPSPVRNNPLTRTRAFQSRVRRISRFY